MGAAEPPRFCTCQGFPLAQPERMRFLYAGTQIGIICIWWRNENRSQLELARKLLIARIMPGAVAQESCQVVQKQHREKHLLTRAPKLWYNFGANNPTESRVIILKKSGNMPDLKCHGDFNPDSRLYNRILNVI